MTRKSKARYNLNRTYKVSPTVKALRRALALGLATAAVAPAAQAGVCLSIVNDVFCTGYFGDTTLDSWNELEVFDTFDPATVEFDGSIYTDNTDGIIAWNNDDLTLTNDGQVLVNDSWYSINSYNRIGVSAESFQGDVTFDNAGVIAAIENSYNDYGSFTLGARVEAADDITITNSGFIASENDGGFAGGMQAVTYNSGTITITNTATGDIGAEANNGGNAVALGVYGDGGTVNITNNGDVAAASENDSAFGIRVSDADTTITAGSTSEINVSANDQAYGVLVRAYFDQVVDVTNGGLIETDAGDDAWGILVSQAGDGDVSVSNSGVIDSYAYNDWAAGITVYANDGDVTVTNSQYGTILADGWDDSAGIAVQADTGDITIGNAGDIYSVSEDAAGILSFGKYRNTVNITNSGNIGAVALDTNSSSAVGIYAVGYNNDTTVTNSGEIYAVNGNDVNAGVVVLGPGSDSYGTATVTNTGLISAGKYDGGGFDSYGDAFGVLADVNGDVTVTNTGSASQYGGIVAYNVDGGWTVGVQASSNYGDVSVTNTNKYSVITAVSADNSSYGTGFSTTIGIYAEAFDGSVNVNNGGVVLSVNENYGNAVGIRAEAFEADALVPAVVYAADGDISVANTGIVAAVSKYDNAYGVQAVSNLGDITISNTGNDSPLKYSPSGVIYAIAGDGFAAGIQAQTGGDGDITVTNTGGYVFAYGFFGAEGIAADTYSGDISVTNAASANGYGGVVVANAYYNNATGIDAYSDYGNISVTNGGYVVAESAYGSAFGINASTGNYSSGTITVANTGYVIADGYYTSFGINANTDTGAITISNNADANGDGGEIIAVVNDVGYAYGINAEINDSASSANITITNGYGTLIAASAKYNSEYSDAYGISASNDGSGNIVITNAGTVVATAYDDAQAIWAYAGGDGNISITNTATGSLIGLSEDDDAYGVYAYASGDGNITVTNAGDIVALAYGPYGSDAFGVNAYAYGDGGITVTNSGAITVSTDGAYSEAYGIYAYANGDGNITVNNSGTITVSTTGDASNAYGIYAYADGNGNVTAANSGTITVSTTGDYGDAYGIYAYTNGDGDVTVTNSGTITVSTTGDYGDAYGIYAYADDDGNTTVTNSGTITVSTTGYASDAYGIYAYANTLGDTTVTNSGTITVSTTGDSSAAYGIYAYTDGAGDVTVTNSGTITVSTTGDSSDAYGIYAYADGAGDATVTNTATGTITVTASGTYSDAFGVSVQADSNGSNATLINAGSMTASASGYNADAYGVYIETDDGGIITVTNSGSIAASVTGDYGDAYGVYAQHEGYGDVFITNTSTGSISASTSGYASDAYGIRTYSYSYNINGNVTISNSGDVTASTTGYYSDARGVYVDANSSSSGDITLTNTATGTIDASADYGSATGIGIYAEMSGELNDGGSISVSNAGDILVQAAGTANGVRVVVEEGSNFYNQTGYYCGNVYGCTGVNGYVAYNGYVVTENAYTVFGEGGMPVTVNNSGSIDVASSYSNAEGITINMGNGSYGELASVTNSGSIDVVTEDGFLAWGIHVDNHYGDINVSNTATGTIDVSNESGFEGYAVGIRTFAEYGNTTISNAGDIIAGNSPWRSNGIRAENKYGDVTVSNLAGGSIVVTTGGYDAYGIEVDNKYGDVTVNNAGSITVSGAQWNNKGIEVQNDYGDTVIATAAGSSITVTGEGYNTTGGILSYSETGDITVTNAGIMTVTADNFAVGILANTEDYGDITITNAVSGRINVTSSYSRAVGIDAYADGAGDIVISNAGIITATGLDGDAFGINAETDNDQFNVVGGAISISTAAGSSITATANGNYSDAYGIYARVEEDDGGITITNAGTIAATANGYVGNAYGIYAEIQDYGDITITNTGNITINANGDYGDAVGIKAEVEDGGDISVSNSASIVANAGDYGFSIGIYTVNYDGTETTITNSGSVKATGDYAYAIYHYGTDVDITNSSTGKIFGVIVTDYGDDTFTNNGKWYATEGVNYVSDFQEGNDNIVNSATGKIYMEDSYIDLGSATTVNSFLNNGKLYVNGDENYINMGTATSVFTNNGASLHFEDGAANDVLTIFGDFAGTGHIVVDANGTSMLADRLYIEGDVISNTANVIDVYLDENPSLQDMVDGELIDIVYVSGTSAAANFNLGIVDVEDNLLYTVDYELVKQINYSGTNDLFSLGFEISGLTPTGVAMSSIAPAVQNLWHLGVGTVFQREGTMRDSSGTGSANSLMNAGFKNATGGNAQVADYQGAAGLWLRAFTEDGGLNPTAGRGNFGLGGEQSFDMKNSGLEFGAGFAFNGQWTIGLLGGVSDGTVKPTIGGRTTIDAKTIGGYMTFTPGNGFYADLSYRSMDFDGDGNGGGEDFSFEGTADGFSLEVGYGLKTASGLVVEPQFQYSSMDVNLDDVDYNQDGFDLADGKSSQTRLGVALRKTMDSGNGNSWTPYVSLSYVNESNASNDYVIGGVLTGNVDTSGNSTLFEGGLTAKYSNMLFSGGLNWKDGGAYESMFGGQVSVRFTW